MPATIRIGSNEATITDFQWTSSNKSLEALLNAYLDTSGPSGSDPNPDLTAAQAAVNRLGGQIISYENMPYEEGRVY